MRTLPIIVILLAEAYSCSGQEPAPPNFSGQWRLAKELSDPGGFTVPDTLQRTIVFKDPKLQVHTSQNTGGKTILQDMSYFTNGFETKNFVNGLNAFSDGHWEGSTLTIHTNLQDHKGNALVLDEHWVLGKDQRTLTTTTKMVTSKGSTETKLVWKRQN